MISSTTQLHLPAFKKLHLNTETFIAYDVLPATITITDHP